MYTRLLRDDPQQFMPHTSIYIYIYIHIFVYLFTSEFLRKTTSTHQKLADKQPASCRLLPKHDEEQPPYAKFLIGAQIITNTILRSF